MDVMVIYLFREKTTVLWFICKVIWL